MALKRAIPLLLAVVLAALPAYSQQAEAKIGGPEQSQAGNLVVLNSSDSIAHSREWVIPAELLGRFIEAGDQLAFSVRDSGVFVIHLVAVTVDETSTADIDVATHTVTITDGFGECDPVNPEPEKPDPGEPGDPDPEKPEPEKPDPGTPDYSALTEFSREAAEKLSDPKTARNLSRALSAIELGDIVSMKLATRVAVETVLLSRDGESEDVDWLEVWRRPLDNLLQEFSPSTPEHYKVALEAIAAGLYQGDSPDPPAAEPTPEPAKQIIFFSRAGCSWCDKWEREVMPGLKDSGWEIEKRDSGGLVPQFDVVVDGKKQRLIGFQDAGQFLSSLEVAIMRLQVK